MANNANTFNTRLFETYDAAPSILSNLRGGLDSGTGATSGLPGGKTGRYVVGGAANGYARATPSEMLDLIATAPEPVRRPFSRIPSGEFLTFLADAVRAGADSVGVWVDTDDNGKTYIDANTHTDSLRGAIDLARERGEVAIFDAEAGEAIYV